MARSTGAVSVISGSLVEAVPWRDDTGRLSLVRHELSAGATLGFGAGHVHDVTNESDGPALSLHVYSPALTSMTFYDVDGGQLSVRGVAWAADGSGEFEARPRGRDRRSGGGLPVTARSADDLLAEARSRIRRVEPDELEGLQADGALVVDIRPAAQRASEGELGFGLDRGAQRARVALRPERRPRAARGQRLRPARRRGVLGGLRLQPGGGLAARTGFHRRRRSGGGLPGLAHLARRRGPLLPRPRGSRSGNPTAPLVVQDANLGVVFTVWDVLAGMARFPSRSACATGLTVGPSRWSRPTT